MRQGAQGKILTRAANWQGPALMISPQEGNIDVFLNQKSCHDSANTEFREHMDNINDCAISIYSSTKTLEE